MTAPVHILHHGLPLCGFSRETPAGWPKGHTWVSLLTAKGMMFTHPDRCLDCWTKGAGGNIPGMTKYKVEGYIRIPVCMTVESKTVEGAANKASATVHDLASQCMDVLKDKASNLAHDLVKPPSGHVTSVTSLSD